MIIERDRFAVYYGRGFKTRRDRELVLCINRRNNPPPCELSWKIIIEIAWDWLPQLWWCPITCHDQLKIAQIGKGSIEATMTRPIASASWTGRPWQFAGWTWRRSCYINRIDE